MARAPRTGGMIPRRSGAGATTLVNFHNQGVARAETEGNARSGFTVEFLHAKAARNLDAALVHGAAVIRSSSIEAAVTSTDEIKQKMRSYLDAHFTGSEMHGNAHRRVSNAAVQSVYYDDVSEKGQFTSLIYSKFGFSGEGGFVDFLLLHIRGGVIRPKTGNWLKIPAAGSTGFGQVGHYPLTNRDIFFASDKSGKKMFLLRRTRRTSGRKERATEFLATLVKSVTIKPSLAGLEAIMATRGALFERHFDQLFRERMNQGAGS